MKRILAVLLALLLALSLTACSLFGGKGDDPVVGDGTSYTDFLQIMEETKGYGDKMAEVYQPVQSEYYYSYAAASVGAFRYAAEYILWLKGEGDTLADLTADSRVVGWDKIAELNYGSPYPSYFEGLLLEIQGKPDEAKRPYAVAAVMPLYPEEGLDFGYIKQMEVSDLYKLRDTLREFENTLYGVYTPKLTGGEWDRYYFDGEYLREQIGVSMNTEDYGTALYLSEQALKVDPYDVLNWRSAVVCALAAEQSGQMGAYVDEGLAIFPEDETLLAFKNSITDAAGKTEVAE